MAKQEPKIKYGLKNVHYAPFVEENRVVVYEKPIPIPGAVNLVASPEGEVIEFFADDRLYFGGEANQGYKGPLEIVLIPDHFRETILGEERDANNALIENADVTPKPFALLFEFTTDRKGLRHVMYNVNVTRPDVAGATKTKSITPQTETLNIVASPASDTYDVKAKLGYDDNPAFYETFYDAVYIKNAVINEKDAEPANQAAGTPADVALIFTAGNDAEVKNVIFAGKQVPGVSLTIASAQVTILSAFVGAQSLVAGIYPIVVEFTKGNALTYNFTVTGA